jgi:hypothetical protein
MLRPMPVSSGRSILVILLVSTMHAVVPHLASGQLQRAAITGTVFAPEGSVVSGASVTLLDELGRPLVSTVAGANGEYRFPNVAPGTYAVRAEAPPMRAIVEGIHVAGALPVIVHVRLSAVLDQQLTVRAGEPAATRTEVTLAGETIRRTPARLRSRGLQAAIETMPGWAGEDNGLLHVRGVDDGFLFVIDGVPVYERLDGLFGVAPDPAMIESVNVMTGYIPAEFGFKSGGVIEVRSGAGAGDQWLGSLEVGGGSDATAHVSTVAGGPIAETVALTFGVTGHRSSRFLDPVHPDNLHNTGATLSGGVQIGWNVRPASTLTAVAGFGGSRFDVPHGEAQEAAGQDQRQELEQHWQTLSWQHASSASAVWHVAGYHRFGASTLAGSPKDTPLFTDADRDLRRIGVLASITRGAGAHTLKIGGEVARLRLRERLLFAVTDLAEAEEANFGEPVLAHDRDNPFQFRGDASPMLASLYAQDSVRVGARLTIDAGVRADWSRLLLPRSQVSPRVGVAYHWPGSRTMVRGSFGRFFQPPQPENLLVASSPAARALSPFVADGGPGGADLEPERQTAIEAAVEQGIARGVRLDVAYWHRRVTNAADPNVFFGTTMIFPNTVRSGRATGVDVRVDVPRRGRWSGYLSYTNSHVVWFGPINGGLFLEHDVIDIGPGTRFTPDHDQRHVGTVGVSYDDELRGLWVAATAQYASGTPLEVEEGDLEELRDRPGAALVDFERGRVKPRLVVNLQGGRWLSRGPRVEASARLSVLNLFDRNYAFNFGNPFSGTHFGAGRTVSVSLRLTFR